MRLQLLLHRLHPGTDGGEARALHHEQVGQEGLHRGRGLQLRPDHRAVGAEIRGRERRSSGGDRVLPPRRHQFRPDHQEDPGRETRHGDVGPGRRGARLVLPAVRGGGHERQRADRLDHLRGRQRAQAHLRRGRQRHDLRLFVLRGGRHAGEPGIRGPLQGPHGRRPAGAERAGGALLRRRLAVGGGGQAGGYRGADSGHRGVALRARDRRPLGPGHDRAQDEPRAPDRLSRGAARTRRSTSSRPTKRSRRRILCWSATWWPTRTSRSSSSRTGH